MSKYFIHWTCDTDYITGEHDIKVISRGKIMDSCEKKYVKSLEEVKNLPHNIGSDGDLDFANYQRLIDREICKVSGDCQKFKIVTRVEEEGGDYW